MNQNDFSDLFQSIQLTQLNSKIAGLRSVAEAAEARRLQEKSAKDRVFAAFEEFQLIQKHLNQFPLWAALRLIALHHDLMGLLPYSSLAFLVPHATTDGGRFPFPVVSFGPLEQTDLEALEYKALLNKLKTGIPEAVEECLNNHADVKSKTLTGVIECIADARLAEFESEFCHEKPEKERLDKQAPYITIGLMCVVGMIVLGVLGLWYLTFLPLLVICVLGFRLSKFEDRSSDDTQKARKQLLATAAGKRDEAIALVRGGPSTAPHTASPPRQLPTSQPNGNSPQAHAPTPSQTGPKAVCSSCQQRVAFPEEMAGQQVNCPNCGNAMNLDDVTGILT